MKIKSLSFIFAAIFSVFTLSGNQYISDSIDEINEPHLKAEAVLTETISQEDRMENLSYIKKVEGDKSLISFDNGNSWEYYENEEKLYFPFDGVYWWQRYNSKNGKKQISLDDRKTWYYLRFNEEEAISEISQDEETWIRLPDVDAWTPIQPDDVNIKYNDNHLH